MPRNASTGVWTAPANGWNPAISGGTAKSADFNSLLSDLTTALNGCGYPTACLGGFADNVNFNALGDTSIPITLPSGVTLYRIQSVVIINNGTTASLNAAQFGLFTLAAGGGSAIIATGTALSGLTSNAVNTAGGLISPNLTISTAYWNVTPLFFRITQVQGAAAQGNVYIFIQPLV